MVEKRIRVLYFVDRMLRGGIQTFVLENMRHMDKNKIQIDYLLLDDGNHYELEDVLEKEGAIVYKLTGIWLRTPIDFISYQKAIHDFFARNNNYDVVHLHSSSKNWMVLYYAKKYGIKIRIAHSHNIGFQTHSKAQLLLAEAFKPLLKKYATHYFACSEDAGKWLFGDSSVTVVHNAVDLKKFSYNAEKRKRIRKEYQLETAFVIGHVGRFTTQKNHSFLLEIFSEIVKKRPDAKLLLVGEGILENEIVEKANGMQLADKIVFSGFHSNVEEYMSAMDIFLFPSLFEGLGLVLIEAQANGLPCFTSDVVVPQEAKISELLNYISLEKSPKEWANIIMKSNLKRRDVSNEIRKHGYEIEDTAKFLQNFYIEQTMRVHGEKQSENEGDVISEK